MKTKISNKRGFGVVGILLAMIIIGLMCYFAFRVQKNSADNSNKGFIQGAGVDTSSYKTILDSTKKVVKDAENRNR